MELRGNWRIPTEILAGAGRVSELAQKILEANLKKVLIVTDPGVAKQPFFIAIQASLESAGISISLFSDVHPDPSLEDIAAGSAACRAFGAEGVIAIGGGSSLDCGKSIALAVSTSRRLLDFEITLPTPALDKQLPPIFAIPTTAGTGSEVGRATVVSDTELQRKYILLHPEMLPQVVILDPELTYGLPATITAWTGMDALAHLLEAYCANFYHPVADGVALEGMKLIKENLVTAVLEPRNTNARMNMLTAASMGAIAFQKSLGAIHALSHPIGARFHAHHGLTNAILMPYVLVYNRPIIEEKLVHAAKSLGLPPSFDNYLTWLIELRLAIGIPHTLAPLQIPLDAFPALAAEALNDPNAPDNPRAVTKTDLLHILNSAAVGKL